jgi:DNA-binding PadR family transcriptional regulator
MARGGEKRARTLAEAARAARERAAQKGPPAATRRRGGAMDVFGGEIRRRDVFPLLVLHLIAKEPAYGNRLIEEIEAISDGAISVNPNTIYPLLRELESQGLIKGSWEHPDKRTRRYYSITREGRREYRRLRAELEPFLDTVVRSVTLIKGEIYGEGE